MAKVRKIKGREGYFLDYRLVQGSSRRLPAAIGVGLIRSWL